MIGAVENSWDPGPDDLGGSYDDDADDFVGYGTAGGSLAEARRAGDDGVDGLAKITAQMAGGRWPSTASDTPQANAAHTATARHPAAVATGGRLTG